MNKKGVPGPRGGAWNASTDSRKRSNGILRNGCTPGASSGTAKGSSKSRRPASASATKTRASSG
nr:hypothetical protein [Bradyrhizobium sp. CCBAU 45389]